MRKIQFRNLNLSPSLGLPTIAKADLTILVAYHGRWFAGFVVYNLRLSWNCYCKSSEDAHILKCFNLACYLLTRLHITVKS